MQEVDDTKRLSALSRVGHLLDEAVDLADHCGESLIAAHIAQTIHALDERMARIRSGSTPGNSGQADGDGRAVGR